MESVGGLALDVERFKTETSFENTHKSSEIARVDVRKTDAKTARKQEKSPECVRLPGVERCATRAAQKQAITTACAEPNSPCACGVVKDYLLSVWMKSMGFQLPPLRTKTKAI